MRNVNAAVLKTLVGATSLKAAGFRIQQWRFDRLGAVCHERSYVDWQRAQTSKPNSSAIYQGKKFKNTRT
jgi:hypothetical protein